MSKKPATTYNQQVIELIAPHLEKSLPNAIRVRVKTSFHPRMSYGNLLANILQQYARTSNKTP